MDDVPPELTAPAGYLQLPTGLLGYLRGISGLPVPSQQRQSPVERERWHRAAVERLLVPPTGEPRLSTAHRDLVWSVAAPRLLVRAEAETLGTTLRLELRRHALPVLVEPLADTGDLWCTARPGLDVAGQLTTLLDLDGRAGETVPSDDWTGGVLPAVTLDRLRALPADAPDAVLDEAAARSRTSPDLARAAAGPVAVAWVEVLWFADPAAAGGPGAVQGEELVWLDGGPYGLWQLEPHRVTPAGDAVTVSVRRRAPADLAEHLTRLVRSDPHPHPQPTDRHRQPTDRQSTDPDPQPADRQPTGRQPTGRQRTEEDTRWSPTPPTAGGRPRTRRQSPPSCGPRPSGSSTPSTGPPDSGTT